MKPEIKNTLAAGVLAALCSSPALAQWSQMTLPTPRTFCGVTATSTKVYVAGGWDAGSVVSDLVDVYDEVTGTWSVLTMPGAQMQPGAASIGDLVFFGAGHDGTFVPVGEAYVYDSVGDTWATYVLSEARSLASFAVVGQRLVVAGGYLGASPWSTDTVDIFDTVSSTWGTATLFEAMAGMSTTVEGGLALFGGGLNTTPWYSDQLQTFEPISGTSTSLGSLSEVRHGMGAASVGTKSYFMGGYDSYGLASVVVDVYDSSTGLITSFNLPVPLYSYGAAAVHGDTIFMGGGDEYWDGDPDASELVYMIDGPSGNVSQTTFPGGTPMLPVTGTVSTQSAVYFIGNVAGDVFVYRADVGTSYCFGHVDDGNPCPCSNDNDKTEPKGGCRHDDSLAGARLDASGLASVTGDTLTFSGSRGPISNSTLFFQANNGLDGAGNHLGDGIRCAGGGLIRLKVKTTDANGDADSSPMVVTARSASFGHVIAPGETLYYQWWIRDSGGSPCGNESNTSNGIEITWTP